MVANPVLVTWISPSTTSDTTLTMVSSLSLWSPFMVSLYGLPLWSPFMVSLYGLSLWSLYMVSLYGLPLWSPFMVSLCGLSIWSLFVVSLYGLSLKWRSSSLDLQLLWQCYLTEHTHTGSVAQLMRKPIRRAIRSPVADSDWHRHRLQRHTHKDT